MTEIKPIRIIALNGSPKKTGNTSTVMHWVIEGCQAAAEEQHVSLAIEWIHVVDQDIQYYQGCNSCLRVGKCPIDDDVSGILTKLENIDGIVVGSPVYEGFPTAQLKTLMDRIALRRLYYGILEHPLTVGVATSGIAPTSGTAKECADMFGIRRAYIGVKTASISRGYQPLHAFFKPKDRIKAQNIGVKLFQVCNSPKRSTPLFVRWIHFLRKHLLSRLILRSPQEFAGVISAWKENGWLKASPASNVIT